MSKFYALILLFALNNGHAFLISECGKYTIRGTLYVSKSLPLESTFVVWKGTQNQLKFKLKSVSDFAMIQAADQRFIELEIKISTKEDLNDLVMTHLISSKSATPNPLNMNDDLKLIEKKDCE